MTLPWYPSDRIPDIVPLLEGEVPPAEARKILPAVLEYHLPSYVHSRVERLALEVGSEPFLDCPVPRLREIVPVTLLRKWVRTLPLTQAQREVAATLLDDPWGGTLEELAVVARDLG